MALTAFVHTGSPRPSGMRLQEARDLEVALVDQMREAAPDLARGESQDLHLRVATQTLKDAGVAHALPDRLLRILRSIEQDGRGEERAEEGSGGSIDMFRPNREMVRLTFVQRLAGTGAHGRGAAQRSGPAAHAPAGADTGGSERNGPAGGDHLRQIAPGACR